MAAFGLLALAIAAFPLTVRGEGWPTGTFRVSERLVGDPVPYERTVAVSTGRRYVAFDVRTGDEVWRTTRCEGAAPAGLTASQEGAMLVVGCGGEIRGLDLRTGTFTWTYQPASDWTMVRVGGGRVAIALYDHADVLDLRTGDLGFTWNGEDVDDQEVVVALDRDFVFVGEDGEVIALGPDGGERWRVGYPPGSIWATDDLLVVRDREYMGFVPLEDGRVDDDLGYTAEIERSMFIADDGHHAVLTRSDDESTGTYGVNLRNRELDWRRPGESFLAAGPRHVATVVDGRCTIRRIADGSSAGRCSPNGRPSLGVGFADDRVAVTTAARGDDDATIVAVRTV